MADLTIPRAITVMIIVSALGFLLLISIPVNAVGPSGIVEIEEDNYSLKVSPTDTGSVDIEVTLRSTETRNTVFTISWKLDGPSTWAVEIPDEKIYLGPLDKKTFTVTVICPLGESADHSAELEISAIPDNVETSMNGDISSDTCTIDVEPYFQASILIEDEYKLNIHPSGDYELKVRNDGNTRAPVGLWGVNSSAFMVPPMSLVDPDENTTFVIHGIDLSSQQNEFTIELYARSSKWISDETVEIKFIRDYDLFHILFRRGPFLVLSDFSPVASAAYETPELELFCLGGDLSNVGLEIVNGPEGATLGTDRELDMSNLERAGLSYDIAGVKKSQMIIVRGYGYHEGRRIVSNRMAVWVKGESRETAAIPIPMAVGGGAAAVVLTVAGSTAYFYSASEVFKYRWLTLALVPLYSLVHDEKVLDHFFRGRLFEYIKENPGVTFTALKEHFEVNNGTLTYHLHRLEKEDLITFRNLGKYKLFYADGVRIKGVEVVISPMDKEIIEIISSEPGITSSQVIAMLKGERSSRTVSRHLKQLERKGFIEVKKLQGSRRLFITGDLERVLMPRKGVVEVAEMTSAEV
jgi:DNA-binding MarR family transcriptional regulator